MDTTENLRTARLRPSRGAEGLMVADLGVAAVLLAASVIIAGPLLFPGADDGAESKLVHMFGPLQHWQAAAGLWWVASAVACVGLLLRHRTPTAGLVVTAAAIGLHLADWRFPLLPIDLAVPLALYSFAQTAKTRRWSLAGLAGVVAGCVAIKTASGRLIPMDTATGQNGAVTWAKPADYLVPTLILAVAWFAGDAARARRVQLALLMQHATDLERDRDRQSALAVAAERSRITRELHDVVAHGISVMVVQTQAAQAVTRRDPAAAQPVLDDVVAVGRRSLAEMRRLLAADRSGHDGPVAYAPQPGVADLAELAAQVSNAGTPVRLTTDSNLAGVDAPTGLAVYRIVQEALTNTLKHAGPGAEADIRVGHGNGLVEIEVTDSGGRRPSDTPDAGPAVPGNGLRGLRERVGMLGGELTAARTGTGFRVHAVIPVQVPANGAA